MKKVTSITYGVVLCAMIGMVATFLSIYLPLGSVALAILLGIVVRNSLKLGERFKKGIMFSEKSILSLAIVLMGVKLDYVILKELGYKSIALIITAMCVTILSSVFLARLLKCNRTLALLLGIGNGVCGSSAIAATEHIIGAQEEDVGVSIAMVNFLGTIGMFLLPFIGTMVLKLTDIHAGILIGNTLQAVGHVTAGGFSISDIAGQTAMIIKMGRILMLTPMILILLIVFSHKTSAMSTDKKGVAPRKIPLFILGFMLFSLVSTFGLLPEAHINILETISHYALVIAMAGVGLKITFVSILQNGKSALLLGSAIFFLQIILSSIIVCLVL